jgi:hypothetical protein
MSKHSSAVLSLLFEAYRRKDMLTHEPNWQDRPLEHWWLGLGTAAAYRPVLTAGLMRFHDGRTPGPRCMGWLCLTPEGIAVLEEYEARFAARLAEIKRDPRYQRSIVGNYQIAGGLTAAH